MILFIIGIILILIIFSIIYFYRKKTKRDYNQEFKNAVKDIAKQLSEEQEILIETQSKKINKEIENINLLLKEKEKVFKETQEDWKSRIEELKNSYEQQKQEISASIHTYTINEQKAMTDRLINRQKEIDKEIESLDQNYNSLKKEYEDKINIAKKSFLEETNSLNEQIKNKKQEINILIEQFKKDEETRKEADFYRIPITSAAQNDINKLKGVAAQLNNPATLYKLIWKEYYENGFNAMIGRVLGDDKDSIGIYKITNIKNQMCYIGQTKAGFKNRWRTHAKRAVKAEDGTSNRLYQDMWENGLENYTFQIVEKCTTDKLTEREKFYIDFFNSKEWGFNSKT
jgi:hypothetical protein